MLIRLSGFLFIVLATASGFWWCALPVLAVYVFKYKSYDLIAAAFFLDATMGAFFHVPYYTIGTALIVLLVEWCKPRLLFYT